jgi:vancomycin resistance protein VanJ
VPPAPAPDTIPVRCSCGIRYNAKPAHAGRSIRCRCGRTVPIPGAASGHQDRRGRWPLVTLPPWLGRLLAALTWLDAALVVATIFVLWVLGDRWWPATIFLFGPRWPLLLPPLALLLATLLIAPRLVLPNALAVLLVLGPVMGLNPGWRRLLARGTPELRLVTFNVQGAANPRIPSVPGALTRLGADIVAFQECPPRLMSASLWPEGWTLINERGGICLASRFPVSERRTEERVRTGEQGGTGTVVFFRIHPPGDTVDLAVVHLETPRKGLEPLRYGGNVGSMELNILVREAGSSRSSRWIAEQSPDALIAGDFNLPVESRIFRAHWTRCPGAFTSAGRGFGYTRTLKRFSIRIDHLLTCGPWRALDARVGPELGSDHRPLIVDLARRR